MAENAVDLIKKRSMPDHLADGTPCRSIRPEDVRQISLELSLRPHEIEITALERDIIPMRYMRNMRAVSARDQAAMLRSRVTVAGLGGLGGAAVEILARVGIGMISLIDHDRFEPHNLNRQFLARETNQGGSKARAAKLRISEINSSICCTCHEISLTCENAGNLLEGSDLALDCLDNPGARFILEAAAMEQRIPVVSGAIAGACGHVISIFPEDKGLEAVYGDSRDSTGGAELSLGCMPQAAACIASIQCSEVIKILTQRGTVLKNRLQVVDLNRNRFETIHL